MLKDLSCMVFVGLNSRVAALDRETGETIWDWRAPKPRRGYVSLLLLDERRLIASASGYTYCLDPRTGMQLWYNELSGFGVGVTSIAALDRHNAHDLLLAAAAADAAAAAAAAGS
jgi:outer membrane protein assembly factor BamB